MRSVARVWRAAAALLAGGCGGGSDSTGEPPSFTADNTWPNIILISADTLRPDHLGCYGYDRPTSPRIDRLADEGVVFENAISSTSWTLPAHAALFTGLADTVHGCTDTDRRLDATRHTLAERLSEGGYATAGFFSGPYLHPVFGLGQGFEQYEDCSSYPEMSRTLALDTGTVEGEQVALASHHDITNPRVYRGVRQWLTRNTKKPFFLFIHMWDVHFDFIPPPPYDTMFDPDYTGTVTGHNFFFDDSINAKMPRRDLEHLIALYDGEIAWTDEHIGKMLDDLDELGLTDSTIVMLVSDHGTEFFEHGTKAHRKTLFDEVIRIAMIVRYPRRVPAGMRISAQTRNIDVLPTLLELAGARPPTDVMGQSLVPLLHGEQLQRDNLAVSELFSVGHKLRSFRRPERKMLVNEAIGDAIVFDLRDDPRERSARRVRGTALPWVKEMVRDEEQARQWLADFRRLFPEVTVSSEIPPEILRQLESFGYIGDSTTGDTGGGTDVGAQQPTGDDGG